jgi:hypothetical protein
MVDLARNDSIMLTANHVLIGERNTRTVLVYARGKRERGGWVRWVMRCERTPFIGPEKRTDTLVGQVA